MEATSVAASATETPLLLGEGWHQDRPSGLNRYLGELLAALAHAGSRPRAIVVGPVSPPAPVTVAADRSDPLLVRLWRFWFAAARAADDVTLVDAHFALYASGPVLLGRLRRLPLVVHFQGPWASESVLAGEDRKWRIFSKRLLETAVYRQARQLVVLSTAFKRILVEDYGVTPWLVEVVPPGVDLVRFHPGDAAAARRSLSLAPDATVVLTVRRLVPRVGVDVLLQAWARLAPTTSPAVLLVVGEGPERACLQAEAARLGISSSVRFLGQVKESTLLACYQAADLSVVPSVALEGFGLTVLESLACGTPVVAADSGGLPEALSPLDPSLIVPAGDSEALSQRLDVWRAASDPGPSRQACRRYAERFSWERAASRHQQIYRRATHPERQRLRVVYLDHCGRLSGAELALLRLLPQLTTVDAHVILAEDGPLVAALEGAGVSTEVLPMAPPAQSLARADVRPGAAPARSVLHAVAHAARLAWRLRRLRPDLVHTNSLKAALYGGLAARLVRAPVIWHVHDRIAPDYLPAAAVRLVQALAQRLPSAVIANSRATLATIGPVPVPTTVIPYVVAQGPGADPPSRPQDPLRIGIVGRLAAWKGQHVFLDAFAQAFPPGSRAQAVIVGSPLFGEEAYEAELRAQVARLGLGERVEMTGFRSDVGAELARLDVLVHASVIPEPFGQVVAEGMAAGLPVVAAGAGGPVEIITDGLDGLLVPPGNSRALADALRRLASDPGLRERLGAAARQRAGAFAPQLVAAQVLGFYASVLDRPPSTG